VLPGGQRSRIARIVTHDGDLDRAVAEQAVTLTLDDEIDVSRGDVLVGEGAEVRHGFTFGAHVFWTAEAPLRAGQRYLVKLGAFQTQAEVNALHHAIDVASYAPQAVDALPMNGVGLITLTLDRPTVFADYAQDRTLGGFILIDRFSNETAAIGLVDNAALSRVAAQATPGVGAALRHALERRIGVAGTETRDAFMRRVSGDVASAVPLTAAVYVASGSLLIGAAVAVADLALRPIVRAFAGRAWRRWRDRREEYDADGSGI
ncbi:MAG TPA: hypothetical protein VIL72_12810, partial [Beijerinckiaceae bacterium]